MSKKQRMKETKDINLSEQMEETQNAPAPATNDTENQPETETETETVDPIVQLETQLAELKDQYLRKVAEFDNYRKRTLKEKTELILNGGEKVITSILPILDDFERAEDNISKATDLDALKEGVELIFQKLLKVLEAQGLKKIETHETDFNTDFHEAIAMVPAANEEQKGKVVDCVQTGYTLNDKVIRHAKVAIGQ